MSKRLWTSPWTHIESDQNEEETVYIIYVERNQKEKRKSTGDRREDVNLII